VSGSGEVTIGRGPFTVAAGGAVIDSGGLTVNDAGIAVTNSGMTITDGGITMTSGGINVQTSITGSPAALIHATSSSFDDAVLQLETTATLGQSYSLLKLVGTSNTNLATWYGDGHLYLN